MVTGPYLGRHVAGNVNCVFFDYDYYHTVQQYITSAFKTVLIGIVTHNEYNFY